jgi:hypothetical protein
MQWYGRTDVRCHYGGQDAVDQFNGLLAERRRQYPGALADQYPGVASELEENGYCVLRQAFDLDTLGRLRDEAAAAWDDVRLLKKNDHNMQMVGHPMLNLPAAFEIAFDDFLIDIATSYFQCLPGVGTVNMRRSFVNDSPPVETMLWHSDRNSYRFLKFFFYLTDVDVDSGPFTYVEGSHSRKFEGWLDKYRWNHEEIVERYGEARIRYLTGQVGDVVIANTTGFHRGTKPAKHERVMYTVNYGIHPELGGKGDSRFSIHEADFDALPSTKKPMADFLIKVPSVKVSDANHAMEQQSKRLQWT